MAQGRQRRSGGGRRRAFEKLEERWLLSANAVLPAGSIVTEVASATSMGDYNHDKLVDVADYNVWRDTFGQTGDGLAADGNANGSVDVGDFSVWKDNFGRVVDDHSHDTTGITLHSGDYIPPIANNPTHVFESAWSGTNAESRVVIPEGSSVQLLGEVAADELRVEGDLILDPTSDVHLTVTTILVGATGKLVSRPNAGVTHTITFRDTPIAESDFEQITHGLLVLGEIDVQGQEKQGYVAPASNITAGSTQIVLAEEPVNWRAGDSIMLPDSSNWATQRAFDQRETVVIAAIHGKTLTLATPVKFDHVGIVDYLGATVGYAPIANLTRSVVFRSENPDGVRGHSFYGEHAKVSIQYAELDDLGRTRAVDFLDSSVHKDGVLLHRGTNQIGRYTLHLHHLETPAIVYGNVLNGSPKWGVAIHNSHENIIEQNVIVDAVGAGIVTEDGNESNNRLVGNYIIGNTGSGGSLLSRGGDTPKTIGDGTPGNPFRTNSDLGHEGAGIWMHGQNNYVVDNIIANSNNGITTWTRLLPELNFPDGPANPRDFIFPEFSGNQIWFSGSGLLFDGTSSPERFVIEDTDIFGVDNHGINLSYSGKFDFNGLRIIGRRHDYMFGVSHNFLTSLHGVNWDIQAMDYGVAPLTNFEISDSHFANNKSFDILLNNSNGVSDDGPIRGVIRNVTHDLTPYAIGSTWNPNVNFVSHIEPRYLHVYQHDGVVGDDFELLMNEQAADFLLPSSGMGDQVVTGSQIVNTSSGPRPAQTGRLLPAALTNGDLFATYGVALAGKVAPASAQMRAGIWGLVVPIANDVQGPVIDLASIAVEYLSATSVVVRWRTDEPATSALEYDHDKIVDTKFGQFAHADTTLKTDHAITLTNLQPNTLYAFRPYSTDAAGNTSFVRGDLGADFQRELPIFQTGQVLDVVNLGATTVSTNEATVAWAATLTVPECIEYEISGIPSPASRTAFEAGLSVRSIELTGLEPDTPYRMRVITTLGGKEVASEWGYFSTEEVAESVEEPLPEEHQHPPVESDVSDSDVAVVAPALDGGTTRHVVDPVVVDPVVVDPVVVDPVVVDPVVVDPNMPTPGKLERQLDQGDSRGLRRQFSHRIHPDIVDRAMEASVSISTDDQRLGHRRIGVDKSIDADGTAELQGRHRDVGFERFGFHSERRVVRPK